MDNHSAHQLDLQMAAPTADRSAIQMEGRKAQNWGRQTDYHWDPLKDS